MEERNNRTSLQGVVTGVKMAKTIVVTVSTKRNDPLYQKRVGYSKKYYVHDEKDEAKLGDLVTFMACRPLSRTKRWRLISIDKVALVGMSATEIEAVLEKKEGSDEVIAAPAEDAKEDKAE